MNAGAFAGASGILRLITLVIGAVDFGFTVDAYLHHYGNEEFFLGVIIACLAVSCILTLFVAMRWNKIHNVDIIYHMIAGLLLFIGGILMLYSVFRVGWIYSKWYYTERIMSGFLGIVNSIIYGLTSWQLMYK